MTERELFKEAVMQYLVDDEGVRRESKQRKRNPVARKILFAAACLLVAVSATVFAIPSARAAVEEWISDWFTPGDYFQQEESERTKEPTIEAIITSAGDNRATVRDVGSGFEAYGDAFSMSLDEIAYDGSSVFLSGTMSGETARPFVQAQTGGDTFRAAKNDGSLGGNPDLEYYFFACENWVTFETADAKRFSGELVPYFTPDMDAICTTLSEKDAQREFQDGKLVTSNKEADALWDAYLADHDVRFSVKLESVDAGTEPLFGQVMGDLSLRMRYDNVDSADPIQVLIAEFGTITVDADSYLTQTKTTEAKAEAKVELGGIHPVTITEWQPEAERKEEYTEVYYSTHELDFTGASFSLKQITFTPTDTQIKLHVVLPEGWTAAERCYCELSFQILLDGEEPDVWTRCPFNVYGPTGTCDVTGKTLEYDFDLYESTISPSQWAKFKTLTIIPTTTYWWDMKVSVDGAPQQDISLRDGAVYVSKVYDSSKSSGHGTAYDCLPLFETMPHYPLTINLDDYR